MNRIALSLALLIAMLVAAPFTEAGTRYSLFLSGATENPPNGSLATGSGFVDIDTTTHLLQVNVAWSGLTSPTIMAHIHCCITPPANTGVATPVPAFPGFPLGETSGQYSGTLDMTQAASWNPPFITANGGTPAGAEAALAAGALAGKAYFNIHTTNFPAGEIRVFLVPPASPTIPTLSGWAFAALGILMLLSAFLYLRRRTA